MIEPFKYLIQPVAVERGEDGRIVREIIGETVSVYNIDKAVELIREFEEQINNLEQEPSNGSGRLTDGQHRHAAL
jgi:hypothetical protein